MDVKLELGDINESVSVDKFRYGFISVVAGDSPKYREGEIKKDGFYSFFPTIILVFFLLRSPSIAGTIINVGHVRFCCLFSGIFTNDHLRPFYRGSPPS